MTRWHRSNLGSGHFLENAWEENWPEICHADVSWPPHTVRSAKIFLIILTLWNIETSQSYYNVVAFRVGFPSIFRECIDQRNVLKFDMLRYPDNLQKLSDFSHGLLICLILVPFWLSDLSDRIWGFRTFSGKCMGRMAWNLACLCILTTASELIKFWSWNGH